MKRSAAPVWCGLLLAVAACGDTSGSTTTAPSPGAVSSIAPSTSTTTTTTRPATTTTTTVTTTTTTSTPTTTTEPVPGQTVVVFQADGTDCAEDMPVVAVEHTIDASADPMTAVFDLIVAGWTGEPGVGVWVRSVTVEGGLLTVDFEDLRTALNNASTSCGSFVLLAELNATAFQFAQVDRVTYQIEGDCSTFFGWLQRECQVYPRP